MGQIIVLFIGPEWAHITGHRLVPFMGYKIFYMIFFKILSGFFMKIREINALLKTVNNIAEISLR